eukprot:gnl/MRDRNA2_/MRDRNA2_102431_c0_seq1.p1 gnl/MRDRNA2_/MRDRNA2_102431_c0~~gnl/MRDRNA2_/MRDRNA2_102431_c0_seq1.p1  ORF type:complete len:356 (-),score=42.80 gnl/MRDRNA2_/MRDRNA2_102431_c0_seq1:26-1093(-)
MRRTVESIRRGAVERPANPKPVSCYVKVLLWIPFAIRILTGATGILSLLVAYAKLTKISPQPIEWWQVILPCTVISGVILACTSVAVVLWFFGTLRVVSIQRRSFRGEDRGADTLIRLAKVTIGTNAWALLVFLFLWLLGVRLQHGPSIPLVYPFAPLMILGCGHLLLAIFLVEPEVDSVRSFGFGLSLLVHSIVAVAMLDSSLNDIKWGYVFIPSWVTYAWAIILCIMRRQSTIGKIFEMEQAKQDGKLVVKIQAMRQLLNSVTAMGLWAGFFCVAQILLTWRLCFKTESVRWSAILSPAVFGWIAFIGPGVEPTVSCTYECLKEILSLAGVQLPTENTPHQTESTPLLADSNP